MDRSSPTAGDFDPLIDGDLKSLIDDDFSRLDLSESSPAFPCLWSSAMVMDRINPTAGYFDHLIDGDFSRLDLSESSPAFSSLNLPVSSPAFSCLSSDNSRIVLSENFYSPHSPRLPLNQYLPSASPPTPVNQYHPSASPPTPVNQYHPSASPPTPLNQYHPSASPSLPLNQYYSSIAAAAVPYRPQLVPQHMAASDGTSPSNNRLHGISVDVIQLLNKILLMGDRKYVAIIFPMVVGEITNLILDKHGSCVLERFVNACDERQRAELLATLTANTNMLLRICRYKSGSMILATLIKSSHSREQISHILHALKPCILTLAKEKTGSDILKCCLSHPYFDRNKLILQPIVRSWVHLAFDKYGVFIVKQVVDLTTENDACQLLIEIANNALELAQHPSGNYLVQHLLDKRIWPITSYIISKLSGHFTNLSIQKYSSNVVENCLKNTKSYECTIIIRELLSSPNILDIFVDSYGNYVMQSAIAVAKGKVQQELLDIVRKNLSTLTQYGYYRRIIKKYKKDE